MQSVRIRCYDAIIFSIMLDQLPLTVFNSCHRNNSSRGDLPVDAVFSSCDGKSHQALCPQCSHYLSNYKKENPDVINN